jgi:glucuronate isomerase
MDQTFITPDFLLYNEQGKRLYHEIASSLPIIDYHSHLSAPAIRNNHSFANLTEAWLDGDHYKWRAMRANGINESYCTGSQQPEARFMKWAETVPHTLRNPLYHWTHLELSRYFNEHKLLSPATASDIYNNCSSMLKDPEFTVNGLLSKMRVELICTTDDPVDTLQDHVAINASGGNLRVFPTFRPDKAMDLRSSQNFNTYVEKLQQASGISVHSVAEFLDALKQRHDAFDAAGCRLADHGLEFFPNSPFTQNEIESIFAKVRSGKEVDSRQVDQFRSFLLQEVAFWNHEKKWVQQYHIGAIRNNNRRMFNTLGPDTGWDSIGDFSHSRSMAAFLGKLDETDQLAKTILYNLNPADNEVFASMAGNFNDGSVAGKMQHGSAWWFLDQKDGIQKQLDTISNIGLLSRFVGMLTDSRSFLSFPRHEYFRRILCNMLGEEMRKGELPNDHTLIGELVERVCYSNSRDFFNWKLN